MGNVSSIVVKTNQATYYGGDTVQGVVALSCVENVETNGIFLEVRCVPFVPRGIHTLLLPHFLATPSSSLQVFGYEYYAYKISDGPYKYGQNNLLKIIVPLGPPGILTPGQYQFGFKFDLPATLPQSFSFQRDGDREIVQIQYMVKARVSRPRRGCCTLGIEGAASLQLRALPPPQSPPVSKSCEEDNVTKCWCCCFSESQGQAKLTVSLDKSVLLCGETINVTVQARNDTKQHMDVNVKLRHLVSMREKQGKPPCRSHREARAWGPEWGSAPRLAPGQAAEGDTPLRVRLKLPQSLAPTSKGVLVQSAYFIEVEMYGGLALSDIKVQVPVTVAFAAPRAQPPKGQDSLKDHPEWKPTQVFPTVEVPVPDEEQGTSSSATPAAAA